MSALPRLFTSRSLLWVLLALSIALNAFFVGGHVYTRMLFQGGPGYHADRGKRLGERLGLDDAQIAAYREMRQKTRERRREIFSTNRAHRTAMWSELAKAAPDQAVLDRSIDAMGASWGTYQREKMALTRTFVAGLTAEQRTKFLEMAERRSKRRGRRWRRHRGR